MNTSSPVAVRRRVPPPGTALPPRPAATIITPPIENARDALSAARRLRSEHLVALAEGTVTISDVVDTAITEDGAPLRRISLRQLHLSQAGWGERRTARLLSAIADRLGSTDHPRDMTVAWLIDPRSGGRRYLIWLDAQQAKDNKPWTGFPLAAHTGDRNR